MIDTLKIRFSGDFLEGDLYDWDEIFMRPADKGGEVVRNYFRLNARDSGGAYMQWRPDRNEVTLECSAKVLGTDYLRGIASDTIEQVYDRICDANRLRIRGGVDTLVRLSKVYRADVSPSPSVPDKVKYLAACKAVLNWTRKQKDTRFGDAMILSNRVERFTIYDKQAELDIVDPDLASQIPGLDSVLRCEYQAKRTGILCQRFEAEKPLPLLQSSDQRQEKVVYLSDVISRRAQQKAFFSAWDSMSQQETGIYATGDIEMLRDFVAKNSDARYPMDRFYRDYGRAMIYKRAFGSDDELIRLWLRTDFPGSDLKQFRWRTLSILKKAGAAFDHENAGALSVVTDLRRRIEDFSERLAA